jgi:excisionase family DNA binding protein
MLKGVYTSEEAAKYLGVTVGRVRQMIVDGSLKTERFGRAHVITKEALKIAGNRRTKPGPVSMAERQSRKGVKK